MELSMPCMGNTVTTTKPSSQIDRAFWLSLFLGGHTGPFPTVWHGTIFAPGFNRVRLGVDRRVGLPINKSNGECSRRNMLELPEKNVTELMNH